MKHVFTLTLGLALCSFTTAQTTVYLRNNTWNNFTVEVDAHGAQMNTTHWSKLLTTFKRWNADDEAIFEVNRSAAALSAGDTAYFDIRLVSAADTVLFKLMLIGGANGSALYYSAATPGFSDGWQNDNNFHQFQTTLKGKNAIIKYKADNDDASYSRDLRLAIHDYPIYEISQDDFQNPHAINVMAYNVQMIPLGLSGLGYANLRGSLLPAELSPYQDAVIFSEIFDNDAREVHLIPAMLAAGFTYRTTILNAPTGAFPWNGGVIIFSRWPIEYSAEWDYTLCGQAASDCFANKGVKYARINKLGKKYHIFGTHMDAGSGQDDILARLSNMRELRNFIAAQNIPQDEAVVYGGDFNISPISGDDLYPDMIDTLNPVIPFPIGYENSTFSGGAGKIIDHVWGDGNHLIPLVATNEIITMRSIADTMWTYSEFSDHRTALGRFVYPNFTKSGVDTMLCPGDDLLLSVNTTDPLLFQWGKDGSAVSGATSYELLLQNAQLTDAGNYQCDMNYSVIFGNDTSSLTQFFFPSGPDTIHAKIALNFGNISLGCTALEEASKQPRFQVYPNPNSGKFTVDLQEVKPKTSFTLISSIGKTVFTTQVKELRSQIAIPALPAGLYVAVLKNAEGQAVNTIEIH